MITTEQNRLWDYRILEKIGQGEYGIVYKVRHKQTEQVFALKKINISNMSQKQKIQAFREVKTLKKLNHPHIIMYYESFLSADNLYIVMEFAEKGDLAQAIQRRSLAGLRYKEQELWTLFRILCSAVQHLHQNKIIHRDIKLENIFIMKDNSVKLGDLGLSKILQNKTDLQSQRVGTPIYFPPELIQHLPYGFGIDIWALGCVFYTLVNFTHPFQGATLQTLAYFILTKGPWPLKSCIYSAQLVKFVFELMDKNPATRPDIQKAIRGIDLAQTGETVSRVSVYNTKVLSSIVHQYDQRSQLERSSDQPLTMSYRRMKVRGSAVKDDRDREGVTQSMMMDEEKQTSLAALLKNVMNKKIMELDQMSERRRSYDQIAPRQQQQAFEFQALRRSTYLPKASSMIRSNGFEKDRYKIHLVPARYSESKSPAKAIGLTLRQKLHKSFV